MLDMAVYDGAGPKTRGLSKPLNPVSKICQMNNRHSRPSTSETSSGVESYEINTVNGTDYAQSSGVAPLSLTSFRRVNDVVPPTKLKSAVYTPSTSSASFSGMVWKCHVCSKPQSTVYSPPLKRCVLCKRAYHQECHSPPITPNQQLE